MFMNKENPPNILVKQTFLKLCSIFLIEKYYSSKICIFFTYS